jgi:threonine dehydratase
VIAGQGTIGLEIASDLDDVSSQVSEIVDKIDEVINI